MRDITLSENVTDGRSLVGEWPTSTLSEEVVATALSQSPVRQSHCPFIVEGYIALVCVSGLAMCVDSQAPYSTGGFFCTSCCQPHETLSFKPVGVKFMAPTGAAINMLLALDTPCMQRGNLGSVRALSSLSEVPAAALPYP